MLTGVREAVRALHLLRNDSQEAAAEAATMVSAEAHKPRKGVRIIHSLGVESGVSPGPPGKSGSQCR